MTTSHKNSYWKSPTLGCICCEHVLSGERSVNFISHCGGSWSLLCGDESHYKEIDNSLTGSHLSHILDRDPSLIEHSNLPCNRAAIRDNNNSPWGIIIDSDDEWEPSCEEVVGISVSELHFFITDFSISGVYFLRNVKEEWASVSFSPGPSAIPIWRTFEDAINVGAQRWPDDSVIHEDFRLFFKNIASKFGNEHWIVIDFLVGAHFRLATVQEILDITVTSGED